MQRKERIDHLKVEIQSLEFVISEVEEMGVQIDTQVDVTNKANEKINKLRKQIESLS